MEDGGIWWRMPINAFCTKPGVPEEPIYNLVLWNSFSPHIAVTKFENLSNMRMSYIDRNKNRFFCGVKLGHIKRKFSYLRL